MANVGDIVDLKQNGDLLGVVLVTAVGDGTATVLKLVTEPSTEVVTRDTVINDGVVYIDGTPAAESTE